MRNVLVVIFSLTAFVASATAKPSDWADVIEKPGDKSDLPRARDNAPEVVTKAHASKTSAKAAKRPTKTKAKKASRRGKAKKSRR